jgi:3-methyl-2-oxobutanoate hydroxymethyltransferase
MVEEALILQEAGAGIVLLECVPMVLGKAITERLDIPVIGIGAGPHTDGQIMVLQDLLGLYPGRPAKFVKNFLEGGTGGVQGAIGDFVAAVKSGAFPAPEHCYT